MSNTAALLAAAEKIAENPILKCRFKPLLFNHLSVITKTGYCSKSLIKSGSKNVSCFQS